MLYGFSQHVIPRHVDWKANIHIPGYWFLDRPAGWNPPDDLQPFLDSGPAPVYIGFGSMVDFDADEAAHMVSYVIKSCGQRGVLLGGLTSPFGAGECKYWELHPIHFLDNS